MWTRNSISGLITFFSKFLILKLDNIISWLSVVHLNSCQLKILVLLKLVFVQIKWGKKTCSSVHVTCYMYMIPSRLVKDLKIKFPTRSVILQEMDVKLAILQSLIFTKNQHMWLVKTWHPCTMIIRRNNTNNWLSWIPVSKIRSLIYVYVHCN